MSLTIRLTLDQTEIDQLKLVAKSNKTSLRAMVQAYLSSLVKKKEGSFDAGSLTGCLSDVEFEGDEDLKKAYFTGKCGA